MRKTDGKRFERFVRERWTGDGGMRGLCVTAGITPETLYRWFRGETEPDLGSIRLVAAALKVDRAALVAAIDGQLPPPNWREDVRQEVQSAVRAAVAEAIAEGAQPLPTPAAPPVAPRGGRKRDRRHPVPAAAVNGPS